MDRSLGADALLNESWATPWLDEEVFPYWPQAARIGDLEDFLRWLVVQDTRRAALVLNHAREFERVYHLVTTELSRSKQNQHQQHQQHQPDVHLQGGQSFRPRASSAMAGAGTRVGEARVANSQFSYSLGTRDRRRSGSSGSVGATAGHTPPFRDDENLSSVCLDAASSSRPSSTSGHSSSRRMSASSGSGVSGDGDRGGARPATTTVIPVDERHPRLLKSALAAARESQRGARCTRRSTTNIVQSPAASRSGGGRGTSVAAPRAAVQTSAFASSTSSAAARLGGSRGQEASAAPNNSRRATRQWGSHGVGVGVGLRVKIEGGIARNNGGEGSSSRRSSSGASGTSSGIGSNSGSFSVSASRSGASRSRSRGGGSGGGSGSGDSGDTRRGSRRTRGGEVPPGFSSWAAMAAEVVAAEAAGRAAVVRQAVEVEAAAAEAEAVRNPMGTGRGKRGRGGSSPEKHASGRAGGLTRRLSGRSSLPSAPNRSNSHSFDGRRASISRRQVRDGAPPGKKDPVPPTPATAPVRDFHFGERSMPADVMISDAHLRDAAGRPSFPLEDQQDPQILPSPPSGMLRNIEESKDEGEEEEDEEGEEGSSGSESWLCMRDPVSLREFWFHPKTGAAEWDDGGAMEDSPGGMGLGLLSEEDRERLRGKFERRQRRVRRASAVGGGRGTPRGTAGLREQVLRKLTLDGDSGGGESEGGRGGGRGGAEAARAAPVQRGAITRGVFFS